jgi:NitT/TauT family transport system substrate-binding protein
MYRQSRRQFVQAVTGVGLSVAVASALAACSRLSPSGAPDRTGPRTGGEQLETTTIRIGRGAAICFVAIYVAEDLLRAEGFTDIRYSPQPSIYEAIAAGDLDLAATEVWTVIKEIDGGRALTILGGLHGGCYDLFARGQVRSIRDLAGKTVGVPGLHMGRHLYLSTMAAYVGLNPATDITWVTTPAAESIQALADGTIDAFLAFPPEPQELRARQIGHLVVSSAHDRPWADYLCCVMYGNSDFVRQHPVATKRALRAIIKANEICVNEPERAARLLVDRGYTSRYDYALQTIKDVPYARWHDLDPEDSVRFYSLKLHELGMIKTTPNTILQKNADWRIFNELKRELKG